VLRAKETAPLPSIVATWTFVDESVGKEHGKFPCSTRSRGCHSWYAPRRPQSRSSVTARYKTLDGIQLTNSSKHERITGICSNAHKLPQSLSRRPVQALTLCDKGYQGGKMGRPWISIGTATLSHSGRYRDTLLLASIPHIQLEFSLTKRVEGPRSLKLEELGLLALHISGPFAQMAKYFHGYCPEVARPPHYRWRAAPI
jgi:hypothetical protein